MSNGDAQRVPPPTISVDIAPRRSDPHRALRIAAYQLSATLGLMAVFSAAPALLELLGHRDTEIELGVPSWVIVLLLLGIIKGAYAVFLVQLPDWSSLRVVSVATLALSAVYAIALGMFWLAGGEDRATKLLELGEAAAAVAPRWCLILLCLTGMFSYASGRVAARWRRVTYG